MTFAQKYENGAQNLEHYREMVKWFGGAEDKEQLRDRTMLYILAPQYHRADICLALKAVERDKGWRP